MRCPWLEDAEGSNFKGDPSDLDNCRWLDSPSDQREDNVTALGQQIVAQAASSIPVPVMAVLEKKRLQEFITQGRILREIQRGITDLCSRVGDLVAKGGRSSSCDRNTSKRYISKKQKLLEKGKCK